MVSSLPFRVILTACLLVGTSAQAASKAGRYIAQQVLGEACSGGIERYLPGALLERDLTGDGRSDLVVDHNKITCAGRQSDYCGAQVCSIWVYVRDRRGLLVRRLDILSAGFDYGPGSRPVIRTSGHGGRASSFRWRNGKFR